MKFIIRRQSAALSLVVALVLLDSSNPAFASLVIDLRFSSSATDKTKSLNSYMAGGTVTIQVWATVTGTDTDLTNDGLLRTTFGLLSSNATAHLTGGIAAADLMAPFDAVPPSMLGGFGDQNGDSRADWRGAATTNVAGWAFASAGATAILAGGTTGQISAADPMHAWEFHVADAVFTIDSIVPTSAALPTPILSYEPQIPSLIPVSAKGAWQEDGVMRFGNFTTPVTGTGVTFTLSVLPEPSSVALLALGGLGLLLAVAQRKRSQPPVATDS